MKFDRSEDRCSWFPEEPTEVEQTNGFAKWLITCLGLAAVGSLVIFGAIILAALFFHDTPVVLQAVDDLIWDWTINWASDVNPIREMKK
jgi:hypothetical protein